MANERENFVLELLTAAARAGVTPAHFPDVVNRAVDARENALYTSPDDFLRGLKLTTPSFFGTATSSVSPSAAAAKPTEPGVLEIRRDQAADPAVYRQFKAAAAKAGKTLVFVERPSQPTPGAIVLTEAESHDPQRYRAAKEQALKQGKPLEIA